MSPIAVIALNVIIVVAAIAGAAIVIKGNR